MVLNQVLKKRKDINIERKSTSDLRDTTVKVVQIFIKFVRFLVGGYLNLEITIYSPIIYLF
jgi:hypothetical protein